MRQRLAPFHRSAWIVVGALAMSGVCAAQAPREAGSLPEDRLGIRTAPILLLSRPEVRSDLRLSQSQAVDVERVITELYSKAAELKGGKGQEAVAARRIIDDAQQKWLSSNLTPEQIDRLAQIDLQWEGPPALLSRSNVRSILKLSDAQRTAIKAAIDRRNVERAAGKVRPGDEIALGKETLAILTPEQRDRWFRLLGRPCAFLTSSVIKTAGETAPGAAIRR
jgi:hypothetical protein